MNPGEFDYKRVNGGILVQDKDSEAEERDEMTVATKRHPTEQEWGDLIFAFRVAKHVKSNAIVIAKNLATIGVGAGQMSRVDSTRIAIEKARSDLSGSVIGSDAFFPFPDAVELAIENGVTAFMQPGGSKGDETRRGGLRRARTQPWCSPAAGTSCTGRQEAQRAGRPNGHPALSASYG